MSKFDVSAAAGTSSEKQATHEATEKPAPRKRSKRTSSPKATTKPVQEAPSFLSELLTEAQEQTGMVQISVRIPPSLKARLRSTMARAGMVQERFVAELIRNGLDELDALLEQHENKK